MKKTIAYIFVATFLGACSTQTAFINAQSGNLGKEESQTFFVGGLGQTQTLNVAEICGSADKVAKVERTTSFLNGLLNSFSSGIYSPQDAKVYCTK